mmetsp:Transcript_23838/g.77528  ORF Transcript_23838/g.77528 Transcript_23838/m.77528 type:complete len:274 (-) Transcript_23838:342-1163(-)
MIYDVHLPVVERRNHHLVMLLVPVDRVHVQLTPSHSAAVSIFAEGFDPFRVVVVGVESVRAMAHIRDVVFARGVDALHEVIHRPPLPHRDALPLGGVKVVPAELELDEAVVAASERRAKLRVRPKPVRLDPAPLALLHRELPPHDHHRVPRREQREGVVRRALSVYKVARKRNLALAVELNQTCSHLVAAPLARVVIHPRVTRDERDQAARRRQDGLLVARLRQAPTVRHVPVHIHQPRVTLAWHHQRHSWGCRVGVAVRLPAATRRLNLTPD